MGLRSLLLALVVALSTPAFATAGRAYRWTVLVTAYCLRGTTATGTRVHPGAIAVDPRFIALGSRIYVPGYGMGRAEDTGSAIHGAHVDVWMASCRAAMRATRQATITVYR